MTWREQLQGVASFRGVPFKTTDASIGVGRRNVLNEYPLRDGPYSEDLGRRARLYDVEGYVIGDDYIEQRDALIDALETEGPGELVHPRYGAVWVSLMGDAVRITENPREGGMARFSIVFVEDADNRQPAATTDTVAEIESTTQAADEAAQAAYVEGVEVTGPQFLADLEAAAALLNINALMDMANRFVESTGLGEVLATATAMTTAISTLVRSPLLFVSRLSGLMTSIAAGISLGGFGFDGLVGGALTALRRINLANRSGLATSSAFVAEQAASGVTPSTASRAELNDIARAALQRRLVICAQARILAIAITDATVATAQQATTWRDQICEQIDTELELADPDAMTVRALSRMRAAVVRDVAERVELLQQRSTFVSVAVLPAVVLAHRIYQDATRADELVQRNGVAHAAFVPAGPLEILL